MNVSIAVPDDVAQRLIIEWQDVSQRTLEALALEAYRSGAITSAEVQRMLNFSSRWEVDQFLKQKQAYLNYTEADLQQDVDSIRRIAK